MAYEYYVTKVSHTTEINRKQRIPKYWFNGYEKDFKQVLFAGDWDKYALYTKQELLDMASKFDDEYYRKADRVDTKALEYINRSEDDIFLISAIWWESGLD